MKHPIRTMFITLIATIILIYGAVGLVLKDSGNRNLFMQEQDRNVLKNNNICISISQMDETKEKIYDAFIENLLANAKMSAYVLGDNVKNGVYTGRTVFEEGIVVYFDGEDFKYPDDAPAKYAILNKNNFTNDIYETYKDYIYDDSKTGYFITSSEIKDNYYYVDFTNVSEFKDYLSLHSNQNEQILELEKIYNGYIIVLDHNSGNITYKSSVFDNYEAISDLNINTEDVYGEATINEVPYIYSHLVSDNYHSDVYFFSNQDDVSRTSIRWAYAFSIVTLLLVATMIIYQSFVKEFVRNYILNDAQKNKYKPSRTIGGMVAYGILGALIIFGITFFIQSMSILYSRYNSTKEAFKVVNQAIVEETKQEEDRKTEEASWYIYYANQLADLANEYPEIKDSDKLTEIAQIIDSEYIIFFDEFGEQIVSSNGYVGYSLNNASYDFKRLLYGAESIVLEVEKDDLKAEHLVLIGVRTNINDKYGALLIALKPESIEDKQMDRGINGRLDAIRYQSDLLVVVDKNTGNIIYSADDNLIDRNVSEFGIDLNAKNSFMNFFTIDGSRYYGISEDNNDYLYYYFIANSTISESTISYCIDGLSAYIVIYLICAFVMMFDYTPETFEEYSNKGLRQADDISFEEESQEVIEEIKRIKYKSPIINMFLDMTPSKKTALVLELVLLLIFLFYFVIARLEIEIGNNSLTGFILKGEWNRGLNLFALASIIILILTVTLIMLILRLVVTILDLILDTKGKTILNLIYSLSKYLAFIVVLYYSFDYLGFDTRGLLASVGFITLAISMGSRDLISDILAGITIVFEGEFQVGDVVKIGDFRGKVQEIGIRYTKLIGTGDNIKTISNRDIRNVTNMSKMNSWYPMELKISLDRPLEEIETIFKKELPKIGKRIYEVISGPEYKGITEIGKDYVKVLLICEYKEKDYHKVERKLNKEIYRLLEKENIKLS